jgi:hypothetical protein
MATKAILTTTPVTLEIEQAKSRVLKFTGAITVDIVVHIPLQAEDAGMWYLIDNACTNGGGSKITLKAVVLGVASTGVDVNVAKKQLVYFDGTNFVLATAEL